MMVDADKTQPKLVVGVGASAGGLAAFKAFLTGMPADTGMAFILVQHLAPDHDSLLSELLGSVTDMDVRDAEQGMAIRANAVLVIPPGQDLAVVRGRVELRPSRLVGGVRLPVDHLFRSLADANAHQSVGIVLSGAGRDGTSGARAIRVAGGLVIAQTPATTGQAGMPQSVIDAGVADLILDIDQMGQALRRFAHNSAARPQPAQGEAFESAPMDDDGLRRLAEKVTELVRFDLNNYKVGTVSRRVQRRMTLSGAVSVDAYLKHLTDNEDEGPALVRDMLISVTEFFRDPDAFEIVAATVVKAQAEAERSTIRIWVAGCASGEEVYSLGILYLEALSRLEGDEVPSLQIFASDIDEDALRVARRGVYSRSDLANVSPERLEAYFTPVDEHAFRVQARLRDTVSFAIHDLTKDPPFSRMHLISCRNVLIYLRPAMQAQVLSAFHFGLREDGCLFLGSSESLSAARDSFTKLSKEWRIFRKQGHSRPFLFERTRVSPRGGRVRGDVKPRVEPNIAEAARGALLGALVPPSIVLGEGDSILYLHGELRPYLKFPSGEPRLELSAVLSADLITRSRAALYKCRREGVRVSVESSPDSTRDGRVRIVLDPLPELGEDVVLMSFQDAPQPDGPSAEHSVEDSVAIEELERELAATREDLQTTVAELETTNEELRAVNEEAVTMNEELQAANEELEAVSEELRSLNEELTTVNSQLRAKIEQVEQAHDDQTNFFGSTKIATMFLDSQLQIKRLTPAAIDVLRLDSSYYGRFVGDINRSAMQLGLIEEARQVLAELQPVEQEIALDDGRIFARRVLPYLSESRRIEGVVVNYTDVTRLRETANRLSRREQASAVIARLGLRALEEKQLLGFMDQVVRETRRILDVDFCKVLELHPDGRSLLLRAGVGWQEGLVRFASVGTGPESQAGYTLTCRTPVVVDEMRTERRFSGPPLLTDHGVVSGISCVIGEGDEPYGVFGVHSRDRRAFTDDDTNFLVSVAGIVSTAVIRHLSTLRLELEAAVDRAVAVAQDLTDMMARFADSVDLGPVGLTELWTRSVIGAPLKRTWWAGSGRLDASGVEEAISGAEDVMVERVARRRLAEWFTALQDPVDLPRATGLGVLGLAGGLAFPIVDETALLGVCVVSGANAGYVDQSLLRSLESMGRTIGDFVSRHASEAAVRRTEARLSATFENASMGLAEASPSGQWLRINSALCRILDRPHERLIGQRFVDFTHPDDVQRDLQMLDAVAKGRSERYAAEKRYVRGDGSIVWVHVTASAVRDTEGNARYFIVIVEDISARRAADEARQRSERRLRRVLLDSPVPILVFGTGGKVLMLSESWTRSFGFEIGDIPTIDLWIERAFDQDADRVRALFAQTDADPHEPGVEVEGKTRSGEHRAMVVRLADLDDDDESGRVCAVMDVTLQRKARESLIAADAQKDEFLAMLGHELRNPLAAIRTAASVLGSVETQDPVIERTQAVLERQTDHMATLLDGLLDVSRIIRGKIVLDRQLIDVRAVLQHALDTLAGRIEALNLTVTTEISDSGCWVQGDRVRLSQVMDNLISNALKYTPDGGEVHCTLSAQGEQVVFSVRDTGIGIDSALLPHVFEVFRQADQSLDRARGGIGLGLALVRSLVELHGGTVTAQSEGAERGSQFVVTLPGTEPGSTPAPAPAAPKPTPRAIRVLLIEDNPDVAEMLSMLLEINGHTVTRAGEGGAGMALLRAHSYDVLLCDIGLPGEMSGYDIARAARDESGGLFLVALSGYGRPEDKARSRDAGFDHHLTKPVSIEALEQVIAQAIAAADAKA